jgi:hypothetical protein
VVSWVVSGAALLLAVIALAMVRRLARRVSALTQSYWELRYDYTRLRSRLSRLDPEDGASNESGQGLAGGAAEPLASASATVSYVPLSTIRKKDK